MHTHEKRQDYIYCTCLFVWKRDYDEEKAKSGDEVTNETKKNWKGSVQESVT